MLYPLFRLRAGEPQVVFDGTAEELDHCQDPRIRQFVEGRAGARLMELREEQARAEAASGSGESDDDEPDDPEAGE